MTRTTRLRLAVSLVGLIASALALGVGRTDLAIGPFGFPVLVWVHLFAAWPVAWGVAELLVSGQRTNFVAGTVSFATGAALAALVYAGGESSWRELNGNLPTTFGLGWLARELVALALMVPWCIAARSLYADVAKANMETSQSTWPFLVCAAFAAATVPAVFADYHFRHQSARLESQYEQGRLVGLSLLTAQLRAAGSHEFVLGDSIARFDLKLTDRINAYRRAEPLVEGASHAMIVGRAAQLAALGDTQAASELLTPLAANNSAAAVLLGSVLDDAERHAEAEQQFRAAIKLLESDASPSADPLRVQAFDSLAETLRDQREYAAAERAYRDGIRAVPTAEAHFQFQLGRHYALGGRSFAALEAFERAAQLEPGQFGFDRPEVAAQVRPLREGTPGCVLPDRFYTNP